MNKRNTSKEKKKENRKGYPYKNKKYHCSIHGGNGNPDCKECWRNLNKLAKDNDAIIIK